MMVRTPGILSETAVSMFTILALPTVLATGTPQATLSRGLSSAYFAVPVTFSDPSMRWIGAPITDVLIAVSSGGLCGFSERANQGAFGKHDFEGVVLERLGAGHGCVRRAMEDLRAGRLAFESLLGFVGTPRLSSDATEGDARAFDTAAAHVHDHCRRGQGEFVLLAIAQLEINRTRARGQRRQRHVGDQLTRLEDVFAVGRVARDKIKLVEGDGTLAFRSLRVHGGFERHHRHSHVRRMRRDAVLAAAQHRVDAVEAILRRASGSGLAFVAGVVRVAEVVAARLLQ